MCMRIYIYISYMAFQKYPKLNMTKQKGSNSSLIWGNPHQLNTVIVLADLSSPGKKSVMRLTSRCSLVIKPLIHSYKLLDGGFNHLEKY